MRRRAIDSVPFSSRVTGRASRSWSALRIDGLAEGSAAARTTLTADKPVMHVRLIVAFSRWLSRQIIKFIFL